MYICLCFRYLKTLDVICRMFIGNKGMLPFFFDFFQFIYGLGNETGTSTKRVQWAEAKRKATAVVVV